EPGNGGSDVGQGHDVGADNRYSARVLRHRHRHQVGAVVEGRTDQHVEAAIAIDVAISGYPVAGPVAGVLADDLEAACPGGDEAQVDRAAVGLAKYHIGRAAFGATGVVAGRRDQQVGNAVAVDVAEARHRPAAGLVVDALADDLEAA